jgi:hypothetical protein
MHAAQGQGILDSRRQTESQVYNRGPLTHIRWIDAIWRGQLTKYVLLYTQLPRITYPAEGTAGMAAD